MVTEYIALDLETTGLNASRDRILEIGAVKILEGREAGRYHCFVDCRQKIPPAITELTGISSAMLEAAKADGTALSAKEAVAGLLDFCQGLPLLGHNILFDYSFVKRQAVNQGLGFEAQGIDTLKIARKFLDGLPERNLDYLCTYYGIPRERRHRAVDDALAASALYGKLSGEFEALDKEAFLPYPLVFQTKKQGPITKFQKAYLIDLVKYHRIELDVDVESLTKNEASRQIDRILSEYGRIKR